jgi:non-heme Fe2+,alpha-ketoglutarate-dependent halogenase
MGSGAPDGGIDMAKHLSDAERARYSVDGYVAPIRVLSPDEAAGYRARVDQFIDEFGGDGGALAAALRTKAHLRCPALLELVHLPAIVEPVSDLLGPDLLCRSASVFLKEAGDPEYVAWHQDAAYWELDPPDVATAWVALTESTIENGLVQVISGSHRAPLLAHGAIDDPANMLSRGQAITAPIDDEKTVALTLAPGQMSIHDVRLAHSSGPNRSSERRLGFAIRYVATHVRKTGPRRDTAVLVRGTDRYGNFDPEPVLG